MNRILSLLTILLLGITSAPCAVVTYSISGTSLSNLSVATAGTAPAGAKATYTQTYAVVGVMTADNSATLTLSGYAGYKITGITLNMHSNAKQGAGKFSAKAGSTTLAEIPTNTPFSQWYTNTSYSNIFKDVKVTMLNPRYGIQQDEDIIITITASINSLYIHSYTITYQEDTQIPTTVTLYEQGNISHPDGTFIIGDTYTLPATAADCDFKTFVGWSRHELSSYDMPVADYYPKGTTIELGEDNTFFAVYATEIQGGGTSTIPINFSQMGYDNGMPLSSLAKGDVTVSFAKGKGINYPSYYKTGLSVRLYAQNTITISSHYPIRRIAFTFGTSDNANELTPSIGHWATPVWTGNDTSVTFTVDGITGHRRIKAMDITLENGYSYLAYTTTCEPLHLSEIQVVDIAADSMTIAHNLRIALPLTATISTGDSTLIAGTPIASPDSNGHNTIRLAPHTLTHIPCRKVNILLAAYNTPLAATQYQVPVFADSNAVISDILRQGSLSRDVCATCDVIISANACLVHDIDSINQFRNMTIHAGGQLALSNANALALNRVNMHALNDTVAYINNAVDATITIDTVVHTKCIDNKCWYLFSLPYDCRIHDIHLANGQSAGVYGIDWGIRYFDGQRYQKEGHNTNLDDAVSPYWTMLPADSTLHPYQGYAIGLLTTDENSITESFVFTPATSSSYSETYDSKNTTLRNWSDSLSSSLYNHGWNFIGLPYISLFRQEATGKDDSKHSIQMQYSDADANHCLSPNVYISMPDGSNRSTYNQMVAFSATIKPFTPYFVQAFLPQGAPFGTTSLVYHRENTELTFLQPLCTSIDFENMQAEISVTHAETGLSDHTGILVDNHYSSEYEIGLDLMKFYHADDKPQLFTTDSKGVKMAYMAIPDADAKDISLGLYVPQQGDYIVSLDKSVSNIADTQVVYLLHNDDIMANLQHTDYTIHANSRTLITDYKLHILRYASTSYAQETSRGIPYCITYGDGTLTISDLPFDSYIAVYDILGRLCYSKSDTPQTTANIPLLATGGYCVLVTTKDAFYTSKIQIP